MIGRIYDIAADNGEIFRISEDYARNIVRISAKDKFLFTERYKEFELRHKYSFSALFKGYYFSYDWDLLDMILGKTKWQRYERSPYSQSWSIKIWIRMTLLRLRGIWRYIKLERE